jgi:hypothetical protein
MAVASKAMSGAAIVDRCELCGANIDGAFAKRLGHVRAQHPAYARGLLIRLTVPPLFLLAVVVLQAVGAPAWTLVVATAGSLGLAALGVAASRGARSEAGARPGVPVARFLREGGARFALLTVVLVAMLLLLTRQ